jgi:hypothetical protein
MSAVSHGSGDPSHGLEESVQANQGHHIRIALPNFSMSNTPRPPSFFGLQTELQLTRDCGLAPGVAPGFIQTNPLLIISILLIIHFGNLKTTR